MDEVQPAATCIQLDSLDRSLPSECAFAQIKSTSEEIPADSILSHAIQIVRLHLRGQEGAEDLKRPFRPGGPSFMSGSGPKTDKASIEAAEKANLLFRKEEF
jgi:hypothetical protein